MSLSERINRAQQDSLGDTAARDWAGRDQWTLSPLSLPIWDGGSPGT